MKNSFATTAVVAIIVGAVSFYGGTQYQKSQAPSFGGNGSPGNFSGTYGMPARQGQGSGAPTSAGRPVMGEITAVDSGSITVKNTDGSSTLVVVGTSTEIAKSTAGSMTDLVVGQAVNVRGDTDSSGTVTAASISLTEPMMMGEPQ